MLCLFCSSKALQKTLKKLYQIYSPKINLKSFKKFNDRAEMIRDKNNIYTEKTLNYAE